MSVRRFLFIYNVADVADIDKFSFLLTLLNLYNHWKQPFIYK